MTSNPYRIGIAGLGTVGAGVVKILQQHRDLIAGRAGRAIEIAAVSARDKNKARGVDVSAYAWADNPAQLAANNNLDAVVELIGGADGAAKALVETALTGGKAVVTANKALIAHHGAALARLSDKHEAPLMYEAAVAGGIPIIKNLREGYAANEIQAVYGILNGTCNFILTEMRETGRDFKAVLKDAQKKGYAEADPAFDIEGTDAAHKLCILTALAFGVQPDVSSVHTQGISHITAKDIAYAMELDYRIKLLGIARRVGGRIVQMVEPCLVSKRSMLGNVEGVYNAVYVEGDFVGSGLSVGRGAGEGPTASAVVADLIDLARGGRVLPVFGVPAAELPVAPKADPGDLQSRFYMHLIVRDKPGVLADVAAILRDHQISAEAVLQRGRDPGNPVSIVMTTHMAKQAQMRQAHGKIAALPSMAASPCLMRIEAV